MNVIKAVQLYVDKMIEGVPGMKALIMDTETLGVISLAYSQSALLQKEVYLFERIDIANKEPMPHIKAITVLKPSQQNIAFLEKELKDPHFAEYHLYFSSPLLPVMVAVLAEADEHELVKKIQEMYIEFYPINPDTFTLNIESCVLGPQDDAAAFAHKIGDGIISALLAMRKSPAVRCQRSSDLCLKLSSDLNKRMNARDSLFDLKEQESGSCVLLILERRDDPLSPLLIPWTYQAMVHEMLGMKNNRIDMKSVPGIRDELQEIILSPEQDDWYRDHMYKNFGEVGLALRDLVNQYQTKTQTHKNISTLNDMKNFIKDYPEFKKLGNTVSRHVALMSELSRLMEANCLMEVSEFEQELACSADHSKAVKRIKEFIMNPKIAREDCVRLVMLYALRYESQPGNELPNFIEMLLNTNVTKPQIGLIRILLRYCGAATRVGTLFPKGTLFDMAKSTIQRGIQGVSNVFAQHKPLLLSILDQIARGKLNDGDYPYVSGMPRPTPPAEVIIFMVGGLTYQEAALVHEFNRDGPKNNIATRVIIGGTTIHNSRTFLLELARLRALVQKD